MINLLALADHYNMPAGYPEALVKAMQWEPKTPSKEDQVTNIKYVEKDKKPVAWVSENWWYEAYGWSDPTPPEDILRTDLGGEKGILVFKDQNKDIAQLVTWTIEKLPPEDAFYHLILGACFGYSKSEIAEFLANDNFENQEEAQALLKE